eukprot:TRINITY_DN18356_c0_g1_i3.p2 TRINITY_DN18356_c0_g1~~TRINITY_DN18356_c0_g1_i3.p2  ORF type:complete len:180 (+),score=19.87 TRINITY_DN18356_c0_g1_i3:617-1156(+)
MLVPDPSKAFQKKGQGFHVSQNFHPGDRRSRKVRMVPLEKLRSASVPLVKDLRTFGENEPDEFRGKGPFMGYQSTLRYQAQFIPNVVKSAMSSQVARSPRTVIGGGAVDNSDTAGPGTGFDESDQYWSTDVWGRWSTWNRWQMQHKGKYRPECPIVAACLLYTSPSPRDRTRSRMPSSA